MATMVEKLQNLVQTLFNEKSKVRDIYESQMFSSKTMLEMKQNAYRKIVLKKNEIYDTEINRIKNRMNEIRKEYQYSELSPERELLQFKKIESYIKSLPNAQLDQLVRDFLADKAELLEVPLKPDYVNVAVTELRSRGQGDLADDLHNHFYIAKQGNEPYKLDPEYKKLEKELNKIETLRQFQDAIMLNDGTTLTGETYYIAEELGLPDIQRPEIAQ